MELPIWLVFILGCIAMFFALILLFVFAVVVIPRMAQPRAQHWTGTTPRRPRRDVATIGERVVAHIVQKELFVVSSPDPDEAHVFVWREDSADQITKLVFYSDEVQLRLRALAVLGAPQDILDLEDWAHATARRLTA